ncbi:MAG TPA: hypothetical protein VG142_07520 [Trebonia sp.]|jgi:hypothetical protein|nr:hypothetical protein [Trebonia sp.]
MSCEHLVCAHCAGLVIEGRCPVCREARAQMHRHHHSGVTPQILIAVAVVLLFGLLVAVAHAVS